MTGLIGGSWSKSPSGSSMGHPMESVRRKGDFYVDLWSIDGLT